MANSFKLIKWMNRIGLPVLLMPVALARWASACCIDGDHAAIRQMN